MSGLPRDVEGRAHAAYLGVSAALFVLVIAMTHHGVAAGFWGAPLALWCLGAGLPLLAGARRPWSLLAPRPGRRVPRETTRLQASRLLGDKIRRRRPDEATQRLVAALVRRVGRLSDTLDDLADSLRLLRRAGPDAPGVAELEPLRESAEQESDRILGGLSDLYAALLEGHSLADPTDELAAVADWLRAEAELAEVQADPGRVDEALRRARARRAGLGRGQAE